MRRGFVWILVERGAQQFLLFATLFLIARIIGPEQFGLFSVTQIIPTTCTMILLGLSDGVIARNATDNKALSTIFWAVVLIGFLFAAVNFTCSPQIAKALGDQRLKPVIEAMSLVPILSSLSNVPTMLVQRRMEFRYFALRSILSSLVGGLVGVAAAWYGYGAMSIVYQLIVQQVVVNLVIWPSARWRPSMTFSLDQAHALMSPGFKLSISYVLETIDQQLPRYLISLVFGAASAGRYTMVTRIWALMREVFVLPISVVLYPALAKLDNGDVEGIGKVNQKILALLMTAVIPALMVASYDAQFLFLHVFGAEWAEGGTIGQYYLVGCVLLPALVVVRTTCRVLGMMTAYCLLQALAVTGGIVQFYVWSGLGLEWYLAAYSIWNITMGIAMLFAFRHRIGIKLTPLGRWCMSVILATTVALASMLLAQWQLGFSSSQSGLPAFLAINAVGAIGLGTLGYLFGLHRYILRLSLTTAKN